MPVTGMGTGVTVGVIDLTGVAVGVETDAFAVAFGEPVGVAVGLAVAVAFGEAVGVLADFEAVKAGISPA